MTGMRGGEKEKLRIKQSQSYWAGTRAEIDNIK